MKPITLITFLAAVVISGFTWPAAAQPDEVRRVVRTFDFEERRLGNPEDLPMHWAKVVGPGYPHYVNGRMSSDVSRSGKYSFRFELNGGSLAYRYDASRIRVMAGAHYRIEASVRTTTLQHAQAVMSAWFADQDGRPLPKSIRRSRPYAARAADEAWQTLQIELSADDSAASFLVLELGLLQPGQLNNGVLGERALNVQDIRGTAWFDDVTISQVPRVILSTERPGNVFQRSEPARLIVRVDDRFTDDLTVQIAISNADGKPIYQRSGTAELSRAEEAGPGRKRLPIDLPDLPAGYYRASVHMSSQGQTLGVQSIGFIQLSDNHTATKPDGRFGFTATSLPFGGWDDLPAVLQLLSAGRVKLAVWSQEGDILEVDPAKFDTLLERLQAKGIAPTACLVDLPSSMASKIRSGQTIYATTQSPNHSNTNSSWPLILRGDPKHWQPRLAFLISRHANHLDQWQIGADGDNAFASDADLRRVYEVVHGQFARLVQKPELAMPWPAWYELDSRAPSSVSLAVPAAVVLPAQIPLYIKDNERSPLPAGNNASGTADQSLLTPAGRAKTSVYLSWLDEEKYGRTEKIRDMVQRVVHTLAAGAERIDLPLPLTVRTVQDVLVHEPAEELLILRTVLSTLSGATFKGKVSISEGVEALLFDRGGQGILAVWDLGTPSGVRELSINLGPHPAMVDLWGNVTPVQKLVGRDGLVSLRLSRTPVFLIDIDGQLMQTRASMALDRPLIESNFQPHTRRLRFTNAYRTAVSGAVRLKPPPGWAINPPTFTFSLNPGETFDEEITLELPYNSVAGAKIIDAHVVLHTEGKADFVAPIMVSLGLSDLGMQTIAVRDGADLIVQQMITNYGGKPVDYTAFAVYPGQSRQERLVTGLGAGVTTIKRYRFAGVQFKTGATVRVGVKEMVGTRILNDEVEVQ